MSQTVVSDCTTAGLIDINGGGHGYGSAFADDANSSITWANDSSFNCVFTDAGSDSLWSNADNWSSCSNGRGNYPTGIDTAQIPTGLTVVVDERHGVATIAASSGGTIEVKPGGSLALMDGGDQILGDITLRGESGCSNCVATFVYSLTVRNDATLTLGNNINVRGHWANGNIYIGNGTENGHFVTLAAADADRPSLSSVAGNNTAEFRGLIVNGSSAGGTTVDISALNISHIEGTGSSHAGIRFVDNFDIIRMNNITFDARATPNIDYVTFDDCTNSTLQATANTWTNINFDDALGAGLYNIDASGTNCTAANGFSIYVDGDSGSAGYGEASDVDNGTDNITWAP